MLSLKESILRSTKSGITSMPLEFSEFYTPNECSKAIKDFCKYYQIENRKLIVKIERAITEFVKNKVEMEYYVDSDNNMRSQMKHISEFRFIKDKAFKDKFLTQTKSSIHGTDAILFDKEDQSLFLIFQAVFLKKKIWYHIHSNPIAWPVAEESYLDGLLKKYENK